MDGWIDRDNENGNKRTSDIESDPEFSTFSETIAQDASRCFYFDRQLVERAIRRPSNHARTAICAIACSLLLLEPVRQQQQQQQQQHDVGVVAKRLRVHPFQQCALVQLLPTREAAANLPTSIAPLHPLARALQVCFLPNLSPGALP